MFLKQVTHIAFYYIEERLKWLHQLIKEMNTYDHLCDIYIHTNVKSHIDIPLYTNGTITIISHDLTNINPYYLTWKPRDILKTQNNDYDIFMYVEDDILVPKSAIKYWLEYKDVCLKNNCNLGFFRIEVDMLKNNGKEYCTDNSTSPCGKVKQNLTKTININNQEFIINDKNPYCAFWIYDKSEFNRFLNSPYYNIANIKGYHIRESSAIGLHGLKTPWYKHTVIPIINKKLISDCKVYHLPNNYIYNSGGYKLNLFDAVCKL